MVSKKKLEELKKKEIKFEVTAMEAKIDRIDFFDEQPELVGVDLILDCVGDLNKVMKSIAELKKVIDELDLDAYRSVWEVTIKLKGFEDLSRHGLYLVDYDEFKEFLEWKKRKMQDASKEGT